MGAIRILAPHHLESAEVGELEDVELVEIALDRLDEICQAADALIVDAFHDGLAGPGHVDVDRMIQASQQYDRAVHSLRLGEGARRVLVADLGLNGVTERVHHSRAQRDENQASQDEWRPARS